MAGALAPFLLTQHTEGRSVRDIAKRLRQDGVHVSHATVAAWLDDLLDDEAVA
jgi:Fe2+ or Zn2+ uptake regulation protein